MGTSMPVMVYKDRNARTESRAHPSVTILMIGALVLGFCLAGVILSLSWIEYVVQGMR
jgi:hypothetical protein